MSADYVCQILDACFKNCTLIKLARLLDTVSNSRYFRCPVWNTKSW